MRQAPALAGIGELTPGLERLGVPDEALAALPGQGQDAITDRGQPLAEIVLVQRAPLKDDAVLQPDPPDRRRIAAGALQQFAVPEHQPLGEGRRVVRIDPHDLESIDRNRGLRGGRRRRLG